VGPPPHGNRPAAVAGRFYPKNPSALRALVVALLDAAHDSDDSRLALAYIVPHASIALSGPTAAHVYARLRRHADEIKRVIVVGPVHDKDAGVIGCVVPRATTWTTPLGRATIDSETVRMLVTDGHARADDTPHRAEHSLEVQLPFLQVATPSAAIVPVLCGSMTPEDMVVTLSALTGTDDGTVVIVTTDLGAPGTAGRTLLSILELAGERIGLRDACGVHALRGLIGWANHRELRAELLARDADHIACAFVQETQR
jgi:AmmeMemoRadiSam system protein B